MYVTAAPGDPSRLYVVERAGTVRVLVNGQTRAAPFLDISAQTATDGERGLLSIAFAPDYATSGRVYSYSTARSPLGEIQIREHVRSADPDRVVAGAGRLLVPGIAHAEAANHNGGQLQFGPDGALYAATGDGGGANDQYGYARNAGSRLAKLLRIDLATGGETIWSGGLRNPFRFSFDRATGNLVIADVGQGTSEEVDLAPAPGLGRGVNYGWPCREGSGPGPVGCTVPGATGPVLERLHSAAGSPCSITGGYVVRDPGLPTLAGRYLYGDFCDAGLRSARLDVPGSDAPVGLSVAQLSSFGEDACGRLYVVSLAGRVSRLQDGAVGPCLLVALPGAAPVPIAAGGGGAPGAADRRAPRVRITARRGLRRRSLRLRVRCDEACRLTVAGRVPGVARTQSARVRLTAGQARTLRLRLGRTRLARVRRALRRRGRVTVIVAVRASDAAGNAGRTTRRLRVRR